MNNKWGARKPQSRLYVVAILLGWDSNSVWEVYNTGKGKEDGLSCVGTDRPGKKSVWS